MDIRILLAGIIPLFVAVIGCIVTGYSYSFPLEAVIGILMMFIPVILICWFTLIRVEKLTAEVKNQGKAIHRVMEDHVLEIKRRYSDTMQQVIEMNSDLSRRIYR